MDILLDSTVFYADPNCKSRAWTLIREYVRRTGAKVLVPAVVLDEITAKFSERLQKHLDEIDSASHSIKRLTEGQSTTSRIDVEAETKRYRLRLEARLETVNAQTLPYPSVTHQNLVQRDLKELRPFQPKGTGYRDALIWYSLLEYLKQQARDCVLVTENTNDFSSHKGDSKCIHESLASDLKAAGVATTLEIRRNVDEFIEDFIKPVLNRLDNFKVKLEEGKPVNLEEYLRGNFSDVFQELQNADLRIRIPGVHLEEPIGISALGEPSNIDIHDVFELNDREVYVEFGAVYGALIYGFLPKIEAYGLDEHSNVSVADWEWNEYYAEVEADVDLEVEFGAIYDRTEDAVVSLEVKEARSEREY